MTRPLQERTEIIFLYGASQENYHETERRFNELHPERPVSRKYLRKLINKFRETGSVSNVKNPGRPKLPEDTEFEIVAEFIEHPQSSTRSVARTLRVSQRKVVTTLKSNHFHPYKIHLHQELNDDDPDRRLQFCETMDNLSTANPDFVKNICFSDESAFFLNGFVNRHNCRYWDVNNPHILRESVTQYPQKVNVWAGILGDHIIGPIFFRGNLNGPLYLQMLRDQIIPSITNVVENHNEDFDENEVRFQQDGAPPHFHRDVRAYLDETFPGKWIGRRGSIEWPARSPDMTPLDFFLWGHLKSVVYKTPVGSLEELEHRITDVCRQITPEQLQNVRQSFVSRLYHCQEVGGYQFEHLIN